MQITVTFRHVDPTPALRRYAEDKVARMVRKYLRRPGDAHVILSVSKQRHVAEITLQADHVSMFAKETTHDLYSAIDLAVEKLEHQAQKLKARRSDRKGRGVAARAAARRRSPSRAPPRVAETRRVSARPHVARRRGRPARALRRRVPRVHRTRPTSGSPSSTGARMGGSGSSRWPQRSRRTA